MKFNPREHQLTGEWRPVVHGEMHLCCGEVEVWGCGSQSSSFYSIVISRPRDLAWALGEMLANPMREYGHKLSSRRWRFNHDNGLIQCRTVIGGDWQLTVLVTREDITSTSWSPCEAESLEPKRGAEFTDHLQKASDTVATWPAWKQEVLGGEATKPVARTEPLHNDFDNPEDAEAVPVAQFKTTADKDRHYICEMGNLLLGGTKQCYAADAVFRRVKELVGDKYERPVAQPGSYAEAYHAVLSGKVAVSSSGRRYWDYRESDKTCRAIEMQGTWKETVEHFAEPGPCNFTPSGWTIEEPKTAPGTPEWAREIMRAGGQVWHENDGPLSPFTSANLIHPEFNTDGYHLWGDRKWLTALPDGKRVRHGGMSLPVIKNEVGLYHKDGTLFNRIEYVPDFGWDLAPEEPTQPQAAERTEEQKAATRKQYDDWADMVEQKLERLERRIDEPADADRIIKKLDTLAGQFNVDVEEVNRRFVAIDSRIELEAKKCATLQLDVDGLRAEIIAGQKGIMDLLGNHGEWVNRLEARIKQLDEQRARDVNLFQDLHGSLKSDVHSSWRRVRELESKLGVKP